MTNRYLDISQLTWRDVQKLTESRNSYVPEGPVQISIVYTCGQVYACIQRGPSTLEPDRPQHDRPAASVIAQQYSSATFVSLCYHSRKEIFGVHFKNVITVSLLRTKRHDLTLLEKGGGLYLNLILLPRQCACPIRKLLYYFNVLIKVCILLSLP